MRFFTHCLVSFFLHLLTYPISTCKLSFLFKSKLPRATGEKYLQVRSSILTPLLLVWKSKSPRETWSPFLISSLIPIQDNHQSSARHSMEWLQFLNLVFYVFVHLKTLPFPRFFEKSLILKRMILKSWLKYPYSTTNTGKPFFTCWMKWILLNYVQTIKDPGILKTRKN